MNKLTGWICFILGIVCVGLGVWLIIHPHDVPSAAGGDLFSTPKIAQVGITVGTTTITVTSPTGARDRIIDSIYYYVDGHGGATGWSVASSTLDKIQLYAATSSHTGFTSTNVNRILNTNIATTTNVPVYVSSTTPGLTATIANRIWKAGESISAQWQTLSSVGGSTATITPVGTTGFFGVVYREN